MEKYNCPICNEFNLTVTRYTKSICNNCLYKYGTYTKNNKKIKFCNIDVWGGFRSKIEGERTYGKEHVCYINGVKCYAKESKFGGIIIEKM